MKITSSFCQTPSPLLNRKYPYLGKYIGGNLIVLFTKQDTGTSLNTSDDKRIGHYTESWAESRFEIFHGEVIIKSEPEND